MSFDRAPAFISSFPLGRGGPKVRRDENKDSKKKVNRK
jgi:hypothetical protein